MRSFETPWRVASRTIVCAGFALLFVGAPEFAEASCNFVPGAENVFRASTSSLDRPFGAPGFPVVVQLDLEGCEIGLDGGFVDQDVPANGRADDDFAVVLLFTPPNGPASAVVVHDGDDPTACAGFGGSTTETSCETELPVLGNGNPALPTDAQCVTAAIDIVDAATLQFTFPDTASFVGASAPAGATLAGPGKVIVLPRTETDLPCELAQSDQSCAANSPSGLLACADEFFEINDTCSTAPANRLSAYPGFTALPRWNDYEAMCQSGPDSPCDGLQPTARFTTDVAGNLLIPINWGGVLVRLDDGTPVPRLINLTTGLPAFDAETTPLRIPGASFAGALSPEGHFLPPIFSPFTEEAGGDPVIFGSVDAEFSVTRINRRGTNFQWCVGGDFDGEACNEDSECGGGGTCAPSVCHVAPSPGLRAVPVSQVIGGTDVACASDAECSVGECGPSLFDFSTRFSGEGCGPATDDSYVATSGSLVPLESLFNEQSDEILALPRVEAIEDAEGSADAADFNQDGDVDDVSITLVNRATGVEQQIGTGGAPGVAATQNFEGPFRFTAVAVEDDILAYLQDEAKDFRLDRSGNGRIQDSILRVHRLGADDSLPNPPINPPIDSLSLPNSADAGDVINGRAIEIDDGLVFFRVSEADQGVRDTRPSSTDENDDVPTSFESQFPSLPDLDSSRERGAMSSDGRFVVFDTTANEIDSDLPGDGDFNERRDLYLRDRDPDQDGIFDEPGEIEIELISVDSNENQGDADSGATFLDGADVSDDGRYVVFPGRANLDTVADPLPSDFISDMYLRDRVAGTTRQISRGDCKADSGTDAENPVISNDGSTIAFEIDPQEAGFLRICIYDVASDTVSVAMPAAFGAALSYDGNLMSFVSFQDLDFLDTNGQSDVYVLDRRTGQVEWVSPLSSDGEFYGTSISDDGNTVAYTTDRNADPADVVSELGSSVDPYVYDRRTKSARFIDIASVLQTDPISPSTVDFIPDELDVSGQRSRLSPDGRYLASVTERLFRFDETVEFFDSFVVVTDLKTNITRFASMLAFDGAPRPITGFDTTDYPGISMRGLHTGFATLDPLVMSDANAKLDTYTNGILTSPAPDFGADDGDLDFDSDLNAVLLYAFDARRQPPQAPQFIGPASQVSVAGGAATFLCEENADRFGFDGNLDEDLEDTNVCFWPNRFDSEAPNVNFGQDAAEIASSTNWIAARVRAGASSPTTVEVLDVRGDFPFETFPAWDPVEDASGAAQTSDELCGVSGDAVAFLTHELEQSFDFNGDGDFEDRYAQVYDAPNGALFDVAVGAEYCEVGIPSGICVGPAGSICSVDEDCGGSEVCDLSAGACVSFGALCESDTDCQPTETCSNGSIVAVATNEANQCAETLFCEVAPSLGCGCVLDEDGDCCDPEEAVGLASCNFLDFCQALPTLGSCNDCDLNGDGDCCDDVLQAYDTATQRLTNCGQAVVPCAEEACDPRDKVRVEENQIRFLTEECDQGTGNVIASELCSNEAETLELGGDLNNNGVTGELIVQICDGRTGEVTVVGAIEDGDMTEGDPLAGGDGGTAFLGSGVCVRRFEGTSCNDPSGSSGSGDCAEDQFCDQLGGPLVCAQTLGSCDTDADCAVGSFCRGDAVLAASGDQDGDKVSDALDNCETTPNPTQADVDLDDIGDACDLTTCGNGILENDESCDDGNLDDGDGCSSRCTAEVTLCDANGDDFIDRRDIHRITLAAGTTVAPGDPRDFDGNGILNVFDSRGCTFSCVRANCQLPRSCGLVGFELLMVALPVLRRRWRRASARNC